MRVYRVHVPTLSVDGLIRTYGTHCTTLNIYNLQNSCFIFYATRFTLLLAIFLVPPTPNSKARYMSTSAATHKRDTLLLPMQPMAVSPLVYFQ
jgi:hypothetical protein